MTIDDFKEKHADLIKRGVIRFTNEHPDAPKLKELFCDSDAKMKFAEQFFSGTYIKIDRFTDDIKEIIADKNELASPRRDVVKIGYDKHPFGQGIYVKN